MPTPSELMRRQARLRLFRLPGSFRLATAEQVERRTDMNDARIALCMALGVDPNDIDPSTGYDMGRRAYETSRTSWVGHIAMHGFSEFYDGPHMAKHRARWTAWNPAYTDGDDWLKAGREAHYARERETGRPCDITSCDLH